MAMKSSLRFKRNILALSRRQALQALLEIQPVSFRYKKGMENVPTGVRWGAIAEEVPAVFATPDRNALDTYNLVGALVAAVQLLNSRLHKLEAGAKGATEK